MHFLLFFYTFFTLFTLFLRFLLFFYTFYSFFYTFYSFFTLFTLFLRFCFNNFLLKKNFRLSKFPPVINIKLGRYNLELPVNSKFSHLKHKICQRPPAAFKFLLIKDFFPSNLRVPLVPFYTLPSHLNQ